MIHKTNIKPEGWEKPDQTGTSGPKDQFDDTFLGISCFPVFEDFVSSIPKRRAMKMVTWRCQWMQTKQTKNNLKPVLTSQKTRKGTFYKEKKIYIYICILLHRLLWWLWVALLTVGCLVVALSPRIWKSTTSKTLLPWEQPWRAHPHCRPRLGWTCAVTGIQPSEGSIDVCLLSRAQILAPPWTVSHQAPLSMDFSRHGD